MRRMTNPRYLSKPRLSPQAWFLLTTSKKCMGEARLWPEPRDRVISPGSSGLVLQCQAQWRQEEGELRVSCGDVHCLHTQLRQAYLCHSRAKWRGWGSLLQRQHASQSFVPLDSRYNNIAIASTCVSCKYHFDNWKGRCLKQCFANVLGQMTTRCLMYSCSLNHHSISFCCLSWRVTMHCETSAASHPYRDELFPVQTAFEWLRPAGI